LRLKQLEIFGFKSFAQKVTIPFDPGITAIVGPNGCGKSNVVEAIRWVLGEQRPGSFRSHRMEDVIFGGTRDRKPLNIAEASLVIDNSSGILRVDYGEVMLTRRLYRSGESDYLLNRVPCRLLDITNLLMDTGLGQGAYAVMEQGMVDEVVSEHTENRRRILEEAAGITKFKVRRRATWSKLESTRADLTRIEDIIGEVKRQVDYLSRQVGRARRYQTLKEELDRLEVLLGRARYHGCRAQALPLQQELDALNAALTEGNTRFATKEADLERLRLAETETERRMQQIGGQVAQQVQLIHERDRLLATARAHQEATQRAIDRAARELADYSSQAEAARRQHEEVSAQQRSVQAELDAVEAQLSLRTAAAAAVEAQHAASQAALEERQREQMELMRRHAESSRELERLRAETEALRQRAAAVKTEAQTLAAEADRARQARAEAAHRGERLRCRCERLRAQAEQTRSGLMSARGRLEALRERGQQAERQHAATQARLQALERVRARYEGYSSGVRTLLLDSPFQQLFQGVVGELLDVDVRCARAVEAALGDALEALVARGECGVLEALQHLQERRAGRAGVYVLDAALPPLPPAVAPPADPGLLGPVLDFVRPDPELAPLVASLLHNTFLVTDLGVAMRLRHVGTGIRLVTPEGHAIDLHGRVTGGQQTSEEALLLGRRQEVRALRTTIAHQRARVVAVAAQASAEERRCGLLEGRLGLVEQRLREARDQERDCGRDEQQAAQDLARRQQRLDQLQAERVQLGQQIAAAVAAARAKEGLLETQEAELGQLEAAAAAAAEQLRRIDAARAEEQERLASSRVERARLAGVADSLRRDLERTAQIGQNLARSIERLQEEAAQAQAQLRQSRAESARLDADLQAHQRLQEQLEAEHHRCREGWAEASTQTRQLEDEMARLQRELNSRRERTHALQLELAELNSQAAHIQERLLSEQHCDVAQLGDLDEPLDQAATGQRLEELRQALGRLGPVHVGVLEEYEEQKERYDFLCRQRDDLTVAAEDLTKTLRLVDRTARRIFLEAFEQIRARFRETFARFFAGGEADLRLEPDVDPLEAAIEITACPRGKRPQSLALLSGGERALTAISLLFAIYLVKPSPFCILDEVDAPLDDVNIEHFTRVLKEFAANTQFIVVTHNKITMAAADTLHGVTMPEEGVSRLVSVRIEDADTLGEAAA